MSADNLNDQSLALHEMHGAISTNSTKCGVIPDNSSRINLQGANRSMVAQGLPLRTAFKNSIKGREGLLDKVKEPYLSAILSVWGTEPTIQIQQIKNREED